MTRTRAHPRGDAPPLSPVERDSGKWKLPAALGVLLVVIVFGAFLPALGSDFVRFDDSRFIVDNTRVHGLSPQNLSWMFTGMLGGHWHPLTWFSWALDYELWGGLRPAGYHFSNLVLHAVGTLLVFVLALRLFLLCGMGGLGGVGGDSRKNLQVAAFFAAAVFAVHPLRVESVVWATERRDVLSTVFLLGAVMAYLRSVEPREAGLRSRVWYFTTLGLLALSLLSKAWGMGFFALMLVLDVYPLRRLPAHPRLWFTRPFGRILIQKIPMLALGAGVGVLAAIAQRSAYAAKTLEEWGVGARVAQAAFGLIFYLRKSLVPTGLSPLYELPRDLRLTSLESLVNIGAVAVGAAAIWTARRRAPGLAAASVVYVLMLAPVLGFLQSGEQLVADRYSHLACIGLGIAVVAGGLRLVGADRPLLKPGFACVLGGGIVVTLALLTFSQATVWRNTLALWTHAVGVTPTQLVRFNYAQELERSGRKDESREQLMLVTRAGGPEAGRAWFLLAENARDERRFADAEVAYSEAAKLMTQSFMAHVNLGTMYLNQLDRPGEAVASFRAGVADIERGGRRPISGLPYLALGDALRRTGDALGARMAFAKGLEFPDSRADAERELRR